MRLAEGHATGSADRLKARRGHDCMTTVPLFIAVIGKNRVVAGRFYGGSPDILAPITRIHAFHTRMYGKAYANEYALFVVRRRQSNNAL